ncbi:MAG TPA: YlxR family protein [Nocardioidaceae bacterium]|nr:YlxR family protein [Nocardioidaceae bacterium]
MGRTPSDPSGARTGDREGTVAPVDSPHGTTSGESLRGHARPVRTCIGCRERASASDLVRLVAQGDGTTSVVPDPHHRAPGRGAHLHPATSCLDLAVRRRAFARAFRHPGPIDTAAVRDWVERHQQDSSGA